MGNDGFGFSLAFIQNGKVYGVIVAENSIASRTRRVFLKLLSHSEVKNLFLPHEFRGQEENS